jgi:hypothetical protein
LGTAAGVGVALDCQIAALLPLLLRRFNSLRARKDGSPWPANTQLTFEACTHSFVDFEYTAASQPAVIVRISTNKAWWVGL